MDVAFYANALESGMGSREESYEQLVARGKKEMLKDGSFGGQEVLVAFNFNHSEKALQVFHIDGNITSFPDDASKEAKIIRIYFNQPCRHYELVSSIEFETYEQRQAIAD